MSLICTPNLFNTLKNSNLLIDTCTIIDASKCDEVDNFLSKLSGQGCTFLSLPSVKEEFTRSANNLEDYNKLSDYIDSLQIIFLDSIERNRMNEDGAIFNIALNRCKKINPSYVDRALLATPYFYRDSSEDIYLITSNHKDIPEELYDRIEFISHDIGGFHNIGIYKFNFQNFEQMMSDVPH